MTFVEWPETEHPALASIAAGVREAVQSGKHHGVVCYVEPGRLTANFFAEEISPTELTTRPRTLTIQRAVGLAPWVGRPFCYMWDVAVDRAGRWIAGPVRMEYLPDD